MKSEIDDVIKAVLKYNLSPESNVEELVDWYRYAFKVRQVYTAYRNQKFCGFMDWVRLPFIPKDMAEVAWMNEEYNVAERYMEWPVLFVLNCVALTPGVLFEMRRAVMDKNENVEAFAWHSKKDDKIMVFRRKVKEGVPICSRV